MFFRYKIPLEAILAGVQGRQDDQTSLPSTFWLWIYDEEEFTTCWWAEKQRPIPTHHRHREGEA
jgi:hypothetical protein